MGLKFKNNDRVIIHSLGKAVPGEYKAVIRGVSGFRDDPSTIWIVQPDEPIPGCCEQFACFCVPQSCLKVDDQVSATEIDEGKSLYSTEDFEFYLDQLDREYGFKPIL